MKLLREHIQWRMSGDPWHFSCFYCEKAPRR